MWDKLLDRLLLVLLAVVGFLLGCYDVLDGDVWWHLRGGQWILENGRVPGLDPFSFASQNRVWVDLNWLFEVLLAAVFGGGGMAAVIVLVAAVNTAALLVAVASRRGVGPAALAVACWLPALLLMSWRFVPRPECVTLLFTALYLLILGHWRRRPRLGWLLPPLQVLWVNNHTLFILGPILIGLFLVGNALEALRRWVHGEAVAPPGEGWWWFQASATAAATALACLVNPYGSAGAALPFELFPKVTDPGNLYKQYVAEFLSPRDCARRYTVAVAAGNWYLRALYFLLLAVPASFWLPAVWRARAAPAGRGGTTAWLLGFTAVTGLFVLRTFTLPGQGVAPALVNAGDFLPIGLMVATLVWARVLGARSGAPGTVAFAGGMALAFWMIWLRTEFFDVGSSADPQPGPGLALSIVTSAFAVAAVLLVLYWGGSPFRLIVAAAFGYLAVQAVRSAALFAVVGGTVLAGNLCDWADRMTRGEDPSAPGARRFALRALVNLGLAGLLVGWGAALVTDRYYRWSGDRRHFGFGETPLEFAHGAARFAGRPGLPERALVYELGQTGVYVFHNAPARKIYLDARLEVPDNKTFETYRTVDGWFKERDSRWADVLSTMGNPLVLLSHFENTMGQAELLTHPRWRCVYFDEAAAVFVPRGTPDSEAAFPTVDFAARHFRHQPPVPAEPGAALREGQALYNLSAALPRSEDLTWTHRLPLLLAALGRLSAVLEQDSSVGRAWALLGYSYGGLAADLGGPPRSPAEPADLGRGLLWAQATYCFRRALEIDPEDVKVRLGLYQAYEARRMSDAQLAVGRILLDDAQTSGDLAGQVHDLARRFGPASPPGRPLPEHLEATVTGLLQSQRPEAVVRLVEEVERRGPLTWAWPLAERVGGTYLQLGRPADARRVWQQADGAPSEALRLCRLAATHWVERDFATAVELYRKAVAADPHQAAGWRDLTWLYTQLGQAAAAAHANAECLRLPLQEQQRKELERLLTLLERYVATQSAKTERKLAPTAP
jgi:tetratricopeptide (TPR) repeat protein